MSNNVNLDEVIAWFRDEAKRHTTMADQLEQFGPGQRSKPKTVPASVAVVPHTGSVTLEQLVEHIEKKSARVKELAAVFNVTDDQIRKLVDDPLSPVTIGDKGWIKPKG